MLVGIMSDSHDNVPVIKKAVEILRSRGAEILVHAGDFVAPFAVKAVRTFTGEIVAVFGNNDGEKNGIRKILPSVQDPPLETVIDGKKFIVVHDIEKLSDSMDCDVIVFGHSHELAIEEGRPLKINPGEVGGWLTGRHTVVLLDTRSMKCEVVEVA